MHSNSQHYSFCFFGHAENFANFEAATRRTRRHLALGQVAWSGNWGFLRVAHQIGCELLPTNPISLLANGAQSDACDREVVGIVVLGTNKSVCSACMGTVDSME